MKLFRIVTLALVLACAGGAAYAGIQKSPVHARGSAWYEGDGDVRDAQYADDRGRGRDRDRDRDRDRGKDDDDRRRGDDDSKERVSLDEAVKMAKRRYRADVVRTETRSERGRTVYHLLLHSEGRVWTVRVDARTGEMY